MDKEQKKEYEFEGISMGDIEVKKSSVHGYGVFAKSDIKPKEVIEVCPVILLKKITGRYQKSVADRAFFWDGETNAIALGYGSIYNHSSDESNATYSISDEDEVMVFIATKPIKAGDEILIDYGDEWFNTRAQRTSDAALFKVILVFIAIAILSAIFSPDMWARFLV